MELMRGKRERRGWPSGIFTSMLSTTTEAIIVFLCSCMFGACSKHGVTEARIHASSQAVMTRIVGGAEVETNEFPFFVNLGGCGGSLIHNDLVLTAAHVSSIIYESLS
jgi:secreted trypsin-like serine protease